MTRTKKFAYNTGLSIIYQLFVIVYGLIIPRLILGHFGSETNGLVQSITQFLSVISFLEFGVGAVIQSSLYKPLAEKNVKGISEIVASGERFFRKIAMILLAYIFVLVCIYPFRVRAQFSWLYTASLIVAIGVNYFAQYYFGMLDRLLLNADQKVYIQYALQIICLILSSASCVALIHLNASIQVVKLVASLIFFIQPIVLRSYVNRHYAIDRRIRYSSEPIKQKWNGFAQHLSCVILENTDTIVLTLFSSLTNVSIYSVYHMVIYGIKQLFQAAIVGLKPVIGEMYAKNEIEKLREAFACVEVVLHFAIVLIFSCTGLLILPFVQIYTKSVADANYVQPVFAFLMVTAHAVHCIRDPYNILILASGRYKETQLCYALTALINVVASVASVYVWGLVGVAIGTLAAMTFQTIWIVIYNSKNIIYWSLKLFFKQILLDGLACVTIWLLTKGIHFHQLTYITWIFRALLVFAIALTVLTLFTVVFYKERIQWVLNWVKTRRGGSNS